MVFGEVSHIPICAANKFYRRSYSFLLNIPICAANKFYRRLFYNLNTGILLWIRICRPFHGESGRQDKDRRGRHIPQAK